MLIDTDKLLGAVNRYYQGQCKKASEAIKDDGQAEKEIDRLSLKQLACIEVIYKLKCMAKEYLG